MENQLQSAVFCSDWWFLPCVPRSWATVTWANEKDKFAAETFQLNFPDTRYLNKPVED